MLCDRQALADNTPSCVTNKRYFINRAVCASQQTIRIRGPRMTILEKFGVV
jgi:hypothetical protein